MVVFLEVNSSNGQRFLLNAEDVSAVEEIINSEDKSTIVMRNGNEYDVVQTIDDLTKRLLKKKNRMSE